jgi:hypothetical protein
VLLASLFTRGPAAKEIAQVCSVLGREFTYELIERLATRPQPDLNSALAQLTASPACRAWPRTPSEQHTMTPRTQVTPRASRCGILVPSVALFPWLISFYGACRRQSAAKQPAQGTETSIRPVFMGSSYVRPLNLHFNMSAISVAAGRDETVEFHMRR